MFKKQICKIEENVENNHNPDSKVIPMLSYINKDLVTIIKNFYTVRSIDMVDSRKSFLPVIRELTEKLMKGDSNDSSVLTTILNSSLIKLAVVSADFKVLYTSENWKNTLGKADDLCCFQYFGGMGERCEDCLGKKALIDLVGGVKIKKFKDGKTYLSIYHPLKNNGDRYIITISIDISEVEFQEKILMMFSGVTDKLKVFIEMNKEA